MSRKVSIPDSGTRSGRIVRTTNKAQQSFLFFGGKYERKQVLNPWRAPELSILERKMDSLDGNEVSQRTWQAIATTINRQLYVSEKIFTPEGCRERWELVLRARHLQRFHDWWNDQQKFQKAAKQAATVDGIKQEITPEQDNNADFRMFVCCWGETILPEAKYFDTWQKCAELANKRFGREENKKSCRELYLQMKKAEKVEARELAMKTNPGIGCEKEEPVLSSHVLAHVKKYTVPLHPPKQAKATRSKTSKTLASRKANKNRKKLPIRTQRALNNKGKKPIYRPPKVARAVPQPLRPKPAPKTAPVIQTPVPGPKQSTTGKSEKIFTASVVLELKPDQVEALDAGLPILVGVNHTQNLLITPWQGKPLRIELIEVKAGKTLSNAQKTFNRLMIIEKPETKPGRILLPADIVSRMKVRVPTDAVVQKQIQLDNDVREYLKSVLENDRKAGYNFDPSAYRRMIQNVFNESYRIEQIVRFIDDLDKRASNTSGPVPSVAAVKSPLALGAMPSIVESFQTATTSTPILQTVGTSVIGTTMASSAKPAAIVTKNLGDTKVVISVNYAESPVKVPTLGTGEIVTRLKSPQKSSTLKSILLVNPSPGLVAESSTNKTQSTGKKMLVPLLRRIDTKIDLPVVKSPQRACRPILPRSSKGVTSPAYGDHSYGRRAREASSRSQGVSQDGKTGKEASVSGGDTSEKGVAATGDSTLVGGDSGWNVKSFQRLRELVQNAVGTPHWDKIAHKLYPIHRKYRTGEEVRDFYLKYNCLPKDHFEKTKHMIRITKHQLNLIKAVHGNLEDASDWRKLSEALYCRFSLIITPETCSLVIGGTKGVNLDEIKKSDAIVYSPSTDSASRPSKPTLRNLLGEVPGLEAMGGVQKRLHEDNDEPADTSSTPKRSKSRTEPVIEWLQSSDDEAEPPPSPTVSFHRMSASQPVGRLRKKTGTTDDGQTPISSASARALFDSRGETTENNDHLGDSAVTTKADDTVAAEASKRAASEIPEGDEKAESLDDDSDSSEVQIDDADSVEVYNRKRADERAKQASEKTSWVDIINGDFLAEPDCDLWFDFFINIPGDKTKKVIDMWIPVFKCLLDIESANLKETACIHVPENASACFATGRLVRVTGADSASYRLPFEVRGTIKSRDKFAMRHLPSIRPVNRLDTFNRVCHADGKERKTNRDVCMELTIPGSKSTDSVCLEVPNVACLLMIHSKNLTKPTFLKVIRLEGIRYKNRSLIEIKGAEKVSTIIADCAIAKEDPTIKEDHLDGLRVVTPDLDLKSLRVKNREVRLFEMPQCTICEKVFHSTGEKVKHESTSGGKCADPNGEQIVCKWCSSKVLDDKESLFKHIRDEQHPVRKHMKCTACGISEPAELLLNHVQQHAPKAYTCPICTFTKNEDGHMLRHINTHASIKPWQCEICSLNFNHRRMLYRHQELHRDPHVCTLCSFTCKTSQTFKEHTRVVHDGLLKTCDICKRSFNRRKTFNMHKRRHEAGLVCGTCGSSYKSPELLQSHVVLVSEGKARCIAGSGKDHKGMCVKKRITRDEAVKYECPCPAVFHTVDDMTEHMEEMHHEENYCQFCGRIFSHQSALIKHKRSIHKRAYCRYCDIEFPTLGEFNTHWASVHKQTGHVCQYCGHVADSKKKLSRHRVVEHGVRMGRAKSDAKYFAKRLVSEEGEVANFLTCMQCDKAFVDQLSLRNHLLDHTLNDMTGTPSDDEHMEEEPADVDDMDSEGGDGVVQEETVDSEERDIVIPERTATPQNEETLDIEKVIESKHNFIRVESEMANHFIEVSDELNQAMNTDGSVDILNLTHSLRLDDGTLLQMSKPSYEKLVSSDEVTAEEVDTDNMIITAVHREKVTGSKSEREESKNARETIAIDPRTSCDICGKNMAASMYSMSTHKNLAHPYPPGQRQVFQCSKCDKRYMLKEYLDEHYHYFHQSIGCENCPLLFLDQESKDEHECMRETAPLNCKLCKNKNVYKNMEALMEHVKTQHEDRQYVCEICGYSAKSKAVLAKHKTQVHVNSQRFQCPRCVASFCRGTAIRSHLLLHMNSQLWPHVCTVCQKRFTILDKMNKHVTAVHRANAQIVCILCSSRFDSHALYKRHMRDVHDQSQEINCCRCEDELPGQEALSEHQTVCQGILYQCQHCGQGFLEDDDLLQAHLLSHQSKMDQYVDKIEKIEAKNSELKASGKVKDTGLDESTEEIVVVESRVPATVENNIQQEVTSITSSELPQSPIKIQISEEDLHALEDLGIKLVFGPDGSVNQLEEQ